MMEAFCSLQVRPRPPYLPGSGLHFIPHSPGKNEGLSLPEICKSQRPLAIPRGALASQHGEKPGDKTGHPEGKGLDLLVGGGPRGKWLPEQP